MHISDRRKKLVLETSLLHNDFVLTLEKNKSTSGIKMQNFTAIQKVAWQVSPWVKLGVKLAWVKEDQVLIAILLFLQRNKLFSFAFTLKLTRKKYGNCMQIFRNHIFDAL